MITVTEKFREKRRHKQDTRCLLLMCRRNWEKDQQENKNKSQQIFDEIEKQVVPNVNRLSTYGTEHHIYILESMLVVFYKVKKKIH